MSPMLSDTLYRKARVDGVQPLQRRGDGDARELSTWRMRVPAGAEQRHSIPGEESILVVQSGAATIRVGGQAFDVSRTSVFAERATAIYAPPGADIAVFPSTDFEAILFSTPTKSDRAAAVVQPSDVHVNARGRDGYSREVHDIFVNDARAERLMVGETFNPPGHWSSFPPHKHDGRDGEPVLEEVYYFRVDPPQGFGQQMLYTADGECVVHVVRDGDTVLLPYGYHPVTSPPGYRLYYLWGMAGAERRLALHEDPAHQWIHEWHK
jgi:5-deoxy-glucuronate isomerase